MNSDYILKSDLLDIIFEKKNKEYGAYPLRKFYSERLYTALGIIFLAALILSLAGYFYKNSPAIANSFPETWYAKPVEIPVGEVNDPRKPTEPKRKTAPMPVKGSTADQVPIISDLHSKEESQVGHSIEGDKTGAPEYTDPPAPGGQESGTLPPAPGIPLPPAIDKTTPMMGAEVMPSFPGGIEALGKFLKRNLHTPGEMEPGETISVRIQFIVGYDGMLKGFQILEDGGTIYNNEVIRVLKKMPAWIPGKTRGENVSVYYSIPVIFTQ